MESAYHELSEHCDQVFAAGLSMGGTLALRLAEHHRLAGLALVNPAIQLADRRSWGASFLRFVVASVPAIGNDIVKPGVEEHAYQRTPVAGVHQLRLLIADTRRMLAKVRCPILLFGSEFDHVVSPRSIGIIQAKVGSQQIESVTLHNSYHVATLDHDAPEIFQRSTAFFEKAANNPGSGTTPGMKGQ